MKIIFVALMFLGINSHDIQVAFFKINKTDTHLTVEFVFEIKDVISGLKSSLSESSLKAYLNSNFSISLNGHLRNLTYDEMELRDNHVYMSSKISTMNERIETLVINNTCLLNITQQSNIVEVKLNEKQRDFLMNNDRTSIEINY